MLESHLNLPQQGVQTLNARLGELGEPHFYFYRFFQTVASYPERARFRVRVRFSANTENAPHFFPFQTGAQQLRAGTGSCYQLATSY